MPSVARPNLDTIRKNIALVDIIATVNSEVKN